MCVIQHANAEIPRFINAEIMQHRNRILNALDLLIYMNMYTGRSEFRVMAIFA